MRAELITDDSAIIILNSAELKVLKRLTEYIAPLWCDLMNNEHHLEIKMFKK